MEENIRIRGVFSVVKFIDNVDKNSSNRVITKTLGKYGFVNSDYFGPCPNHDEFWLVKIDREIRANSVQGCFILTPVKSLHRQQIETLVPGTGSYTEFNEDGIRYILPLDKERYYILPLTHRKHVKSVSAIIVVNFSLAQFQDKRYFFTNQAEEDEIPTPYSGVQR